MKNSLSYAGSHSELKLSSRYIQRFLRTSKEWKQTRVVGQMYCAVHPLQIFLQVHKMKTTSLLCNWNLQIMSEHNGLKQLYPQSRCRQISLGPLLSSVICACQWWGGRYPLSMDCFHSQLAIFREQPVETSHVLKNQYREQLGISSQQMLPAVEVWEDFQYSPGGECVSVCGGVWAPVYTPYLCTFLSQGY